MIARFAMAAALAAASLAPPARAAIDPDATWDAHAAGGLLDARYASADACAADLATARQIEGATDSDIDPRLRNLFAQAECLAETGETGDAYWAMRVSWPGAN